MTPANNKPVSSIIPKLIAAKNPRIDHKSGIMNKLIGTLSTESKSIPNVKIVVGQGNPNVGDAG